MNTDEFLPININSPLDYKPSENLFSDVCGIIETAQQTASRAVDLSLVRRN